MSPDPAERFSVDLLTHRAELIISRDQHLVTEREQWRGRRDCSGLLPSTAPTPVATPSTGASIDHILAVSGPASRPPDDHAISDGLLVICGSDNTPASWVTAGQASSAMWLSAHRGHLPAVPFSQVIDVAETRQALKHDLLRGLASPSLHLRIGWQAIGRSQLPRTTRRLHDEVLRP